MLIAFQEVNLFVCRLAIHERDPQKHHKILDLELSEGEWEHVQLLLSLLGVRLWIKYIMCMLISNYSMPRRRNVHFWLTVAQPYMLLCPL